MRSKRKTIRRKRATRSKTKRILFRGGGNTIISTRDPGFTRYWFLTIDDDVPKRQETSYAYVVNLIEKILNDPRGLKKGGYKFEKLDPKFGVISRQDKKNWRNVFHIRLSSGKTVTRNCGFTDLSCADLSSNEIFLNDKNWIYGTEASGLGHSDYTKYVLQHEIMHLLGRSHAKWPNDPKKPCGVLSQQTIRPSENSCYPNVWPLQGDFDL